MRKSIFFGILCFLMISLIPTKLTNGCGYYDFGHYVYTFTNPNIIEEPSYRPFFFTFMYHYDEWKGEEIATEENLNEWKAYFKDQGKVEDFAYLIYKTSIKDIEGLQAGKAPLSSSFSGQMVNTVKKDQEFLDYLIFAKQCEPIAVDRSFSWSGQLENRDKIQKDAQHLIEEGLTAFHSCNNDFLKLRYAFQIVRLARYSMKWEETIRLYDLLMPEVKNVNSIIRYWTMEHYAGALYNMRRGAEAAYYFAKVFDKCGSRRKAAYTSFEITSDYMWQAVMDMCQNNDEKVSIYALRAITPFSNAVEEMETIYNLQPTSSHLELLLIREMQKFEYELLGADYSSSHNSVTFREYDYGTADGQVSLPRKGGNSYLNRLVKLSEKASKEGKVQHPHLWKLAQGYLSFMNGDRKTAMSILNKLSKNKSLDKYFQNQITVFKAAIEVDGFTEINDKNELRALELMPLLKNVIQPVWGESGVSEQANFLMDKLAVLYQKQGDHAKAYLCKEWTFGELLYRPDLKVATGLLELYDRKDSFNDFEKELVKPIFYEYKWGTNGMEYTKPIADLRNQLLEMKGTLLLAQNKLEDAIAVFKQLPEAYHLQDHTFDQDNWDSPQNSRERFNISNRSPFHLYTYMNQKQAVTDETFNKLKLAQTLLKLEKHVESKGENLAEAYFMLGNIHYQTGHDGKAWRAKTYNWGVYDEGYDLSNQLALDYLKKAIEVSGENDREWAAKACFVASACKVQSEPEAQKKYFSKLKDEYSDTEFYQQAIQECFYFSSFVN